jgi:hypothetical protein
VRRLVSIVTRALHTICLICPGSKAGISQWSSYKKARVSPGFFVLLPVVVPDC